MENKKDTRAALLAALASLPKTLFPLRVLTTVEDDNGCEYGCLAPSMCPGREREHALFDLYNGPETNPCEYPVAQLREADIKAILREIDETFPASVPQAVKDLIAPDPQKRQKVWDDMDAIAEVVAEEAGQNLPYCPSIDFSVFPYLVALLFDEEQRKANGCDFLDQGDETLNTLRFLADNGRLIPTTLKGADMETYEKYIRYHEDDILDEIREDIEGYYEDSVGKKINK